MSYYNKWRDEVEETQAATRRGTGIRLATVLILLAGALTVASIIIKPADPALVCCVTPIAAPHDHPPAPRVISAQEVCQEYKTWSDATNANKLAELEKFCEVK